MDADRFDALARSLMGVAPSRRQVFTGLAGSILATRATPLGFGEAGATHFGCVHVGKRCTHTRQCCSSRCKHGRCRAHHEGSCTAAKDVCLTGEFGCGGGSCVCKRTTGGANFCAVFGADSCMECSTDAECADAFAAPGAACIDANHGNCLCPNGSTTLCARPCPT
jgi:hypothetical protein